MDVEAVGGQHYRLAQAAAARHRAVQQRDRFIAREDQRIIDAEVRATRRAMLQMLRARGGRDAVAFLDEDFLRVADGPAIFQAIVIAAIRTTGPEFVDLQLHDHQTGRLHIVAQHGFTPDFLHSFAVVDGGAPTACAEAARGGRPVLVDDIARHAIFVGQSTRDALLHTGSRAVYSYPLLPPSGVIAGVLSFHHRNPSPRLDMAQLVAGAAARALAPVRHPRSHRDVDHKDHLAHGRRQDQQ